MQTTPPSTEPIRLGSITDIRRPLCPVCVQWFTVREGADRAFPGICGTGRVVHTGPGASLRYLPVILTCVPVQKPQRRSSELLQVVVFANRH
jgi:hypothetical protein